MGIKYESYESGDVGNASFYGDIHRGQTFTPQIEHPLGSVILYLIQGGGSPTGTVTVNVYACDGSHHPTGSILATGTFDAADVGGSAAWLQVALTGFPTLLVDTEYCFTVNHPTGDNSNKVGLRVNTSSDGYTRGELIGSNDGGSDWTVFDDEDYDALFQEWSGTSTIPTVTTLACSSVIAENAWGNGALYDLGGSAVTAHGHCWATTTNPTSTPSSTNFVADNGAAPNPTHFESHITDLIPGTLYYVRAFATNTSGTAYGENVTIAGDVTTIGGRYWWVEDEDFHFIGESGTERKTQGIAVASDSDILAWFD